MTQTAPKVPANLKPFVDALGVDRTLELVLSVGGTEIYLPKHSSRRSITARTIGAENVDRLASELGYGYYKVPLAREWCAEVLRARGESNAEIARTVRVDVGTVRRWLPEKEIAAAQMNLFPTSSPTSE